MRIQIEMPEKRVKELEALMKEASITTKKELVNNALTLFEWAIRQRKSGRVIGSLDTQESSFREVLLPVFANIQSVATNQVDSTFDEFFKAGLDTVADLEKDKKSKTKQHLIDAIMEIPTEDIFARIGKKT